MPQIYLSEEQRYAIEELVAAKIAAATGNADLQDSIRCMEAEKAFHNAFTEPDEE